MSVVVGLLSVELHLAECHSLKAKRMVLRRLKDRLQQLNVAVAELDHQRLWQRAELGIVTIGGREELVRQALTAALDSIERLEPGRVLRSDIELIA